ncbi:MAG: hypothetical protein Tsb0015_01350 [Simkaniaceae bacterium]
MENPIQRIESGSLLWVKAVPKSTQNKIIGWEGKYLKIKLQAAPEKGRANEALIQYLSKILSIPKKDIAMKSGASSRLKQLIIHGIFPEDLIKIFNRIIQNKKS